MPGIQIAIDGPAASGKSTVAKLVAAALGGFYINTGDMYRAVTRAILDAGIDADADPEAAVAILDGLDLRYRLVDGVPVLHLNDEPVEQERIRAPEVAKVVSFVARIAGVRDWLRDRQRETRALGTIVMEGRDIGTVILPEAAYKFYMTASPEVRAERRLAQDGEVRDGATLASVAAEIAERDRIDTTRAIAPLRPAVDAAFIDTDPLTPQQVADLIVSRVSGGDRMSESYAKLDYRVPYADTDQMGVVYYGNYLTYFERARNELLRGLGLTYHEIEQRGFGLPVLSAHVDYKSPARYDDVLEIRGWVGERRAVRVQVNCAVFRGEQLLAEGHTVHALVDLATLRPTRFPPEWAAILDREHPPASL